MEKLQLENGPLNGQGQVAPTVKALRATLCSQQVAKRERALCSHFQFCTNKTLVCLCMCLSLCSCGKSLLTSRAAVSQASISLSLIVIVICVQTPRSLATYKANTIGIMECAARAKSGC